MLLLCTGAGDVLTGAELLEGSTLCGVEDLTSGALVLVEGVVVLDGAVALRVDVLFAERLVVPEALTGPLFRMVV